MTDLMTCLAMQERMAAAFAGSADRRERLEIEAHAHGCARCADAFRDLAATSVALYRAFSPLRQATVALSPARVRLAARVPVPVPLAIRMSRLTARLTEVALAAAVTAFAFVGSASVAPQQALVDEVSATAEIPTHVTAHPEDQTVMRWIRIGRYAASPDLVDPAVTPPRDEEDPSQPIVRDRAGLVR